MHPALLIVVLTGCSVIGLPPVQIRNGAVHCTSESSLPALDLAAAATLGVIMGTTAALTIGLDSEAPPSAAKRVGAGMAFGAGMFVLAWPLWGSAVYGYRKLRKCRRLQRGPLDNVDL